VIRPSRASAASSLATGTPDRAEGGRVVLKLMCDGASNVNKVYEEVYEGMHRRELLKMERESVKIKLKQEQLQFIEYSSNKLSSMIGLQDAKQLDRLTGNPLVALKILTSIFRRARKLADLEEQGKIEL
jgi:hypothetical protein